MKKIVGSSHRFVLHQASLLLAVALAFVATPSFAAKILDLRTGKNDEFTRIVVDLDQPTTYHVSEQVGASGSELVLTVKAGGSAQTVKVATRFVNSIQVKPGASETQILVQLPHKNASVKDSILQNPPRIVLDIAASKKSATPTQAAASAPTTASAKPAAAPTTAAEKPIAASSSSASAKPMQPIPVTQAVAPAKTEELQQSTPKSVEASSSAPTTASSTLKSVGSSNSEPSAEEISLEDGTSAEDVADQGALARRDETTAPKDAATKKPSAASSKEESPLSILEGFYEPIRSQLEGLPALVGLAVLALLVLLIFVLKKRRKSSTGTRASKEEEESEAEDDDSLFGSEPWEAGRASSAKKAEPESHESEFAFPIRPSAPVTARAPEPSPQSFASAPPASIPSVDAVSKADFEALEARAKSLEDQMSGLTAARERLEAQIKSQAEELRVQRAAIARTQRVVRSLASAEDDMPAESAPKAPAD